MKRGKALSLQAGPVDEQPGRARGSGSTVPRERPGQLLCGDTLSPGPWVGLKSSAACHVFVSSQGIRQVTPDSVSTEASGSPEAGSEEGVSSFLGEKQVPALLSLHTHLLQPCVSTFTCLPRCTLC